MIDLAAQLDPPLIPVVVDGDAWSRLSRCQWSWASVPGFRFAWPPLLLYRRGA